MGVPHTFAPVHKTVALVGVPTLPVKVTDAELQVNVWFGPALTDEGTVVF